MNCGTFLLALVGLCGVVIQTAQGQCLAQLQRSGRCYKQIDSAKEQGQRSTERGQQQEKSQYKKVAEDCLRGEGCQTSDPLDPKDIAVQVCTNQLQPKVYQKIEQCLQRGGERGFKLPNELRRQRKGPRKFKEKARISVKTASRRCEKDLKKNNLSIKINRCIRKNMPKRSSTATNQKQSVLGLAGKFQKFCGKRKECQEMLNQRCTSKICRCVEQVRKDGDVKRTLEGCMRQQMKRGGATYDGSSDAGEFVDRICRKGLRVCQQSGKQDICRTEDNPLLKLFNLGGGNPLAGLGGKLGGTNPFGSLGSTNLGSLLGGK